MSRDERRDAIVVATIPLLELHGSQVSTRQIAVAAGVAEGTLFRAFDDKVELLSAAAARALDSTAAVAEIDGLPAAGSLAAELTQVAQVVTERGRRVRRVMFAVHGVLASEEGRRAGAVRGARGADALGRTPPSGPGPTPAHTPAHPHGPGRDARVRALTDSRAAIARRLEPFRAELRVEPERLAQLLLATIMGQGPPLVPEDAEVPITELVDVLLHGVAGP
jgi:AcrR family transcriptional regulator